MFSESFFSMRATNRFEEKVHKCSTAFSRRNCDIRARIGLMSIFPVAVIVSSSNYLLIGEERGRCTCLLVVSFLSQDYVLGPYSATFLNVKTRKQIKVSDVVKQSFSSDFRKKSKFRKSLRLEPLKMNTVNKILFILENSPQCSAGETRNTTRKSVVLHLALFKKSSK